MKNDGFDTRKERTWKSKLHFRFDNTAMPRIFPYLGVTKNEIATKVMHSRNAERAIKVIEGASTDMQDILLLCERYDIDLAQMIVLPNGKHPVIITEEEYERLMNAASDEHQHDEETLEDEHQEEVIMVPEARIDNANAAAMISIIRDNGQKIAQLYERIMDLTADNARLKTVLGRYELNNTLRSYVSDDTDSNDNQ